MKVPAVITNNLGRHILKFQKVSPRLGFVLGIAGVGVSTVLACRATLKLEEVLEDFKQDIDDQKEAREVGSEADYRRDLAYAYVKGTYSLVKLYAPAIILGSASLGALTSSHIALSRRNAGLTAAYAAISESFESYRDRVRAEVGEEKELDIYHAARMEAMAVDGKTKELRVADPNKWSPYARFFDATSANWHKDAEYNLIFIRAQQNYANHLLHARGHIFLNEVYDQLGLPRSQAGQVVGWVLGQGGDNFIDFGIYEASNVGFVNGWEPNVILDFNVDGVIYDKI